MRHASPDRFPPYERLHIVPARRVAKALGYQTVMTYTLFSERGTSVRDSGWRQAGLTSGRAWMPVGGSRATRTR